MHRHRCGPSAMDALLPVLYEHFISLAIYLHFLMYDELFYKKYRANLGVDVMHSSKQYHKHVTIFLIPATGM